MPKPRYNPQSNIGVNVLESIILGLNWIFRTQDKDDMGIDAHIEIVKEGNPNGALCAVQIKTGNSFLNDKGKSLYFKFDNIHYEYWINHSLPVLLVVHIPEKKKTYWQFVNKNTTKKRNKNWQLEIPNNHELTEYLDLFKKKFLIALTNIPIEKIMTESSKLDSLSENWSIDFIKKENQIISTVVPKHQKSYEVEPLKQTFTFKSDFIIDGIPISRLAQNPSLITKPITFSKDMIESYHASEYLQKSLNLIKIPDYFKIIPLPKPKNRVLLKFIDFQSSENLINDIEIELENKFDDKLILSNKSQNVPYKLTITINKEKSQNDVQLSVKRGGYLLNDILIGFQILTAFSKGGILSITEMTTNNSLIVSDIKPTMTNNENQKYLELLQKLKFIQEKFRLQFTLPDRNFNNDEINKIQSIYLIISGNIVSCRDFESFNVEVSFELLNEILQKIESSGSISYYFIEEHYKEEIFDNIIDLGKVHNYCDSLVVMNEIKNIIQTKTIIPKDKKIKISLFPKNNSLLYQIYEKYFDDGHEINEDAMRKMVNVINHQNSN